MSEKDHELWQAVHTQGNAIIALEANQRAISDNLSTITNSLQQLNEKVAAQSTTKWDNIWQASAVALTVGGFFWFVITGDVHDLRERVIIHQSDGHPHTVKEKIDGNDRHLNEKIDNIEKRLERIDDRTKILFKDGKPY